jgi:signal peptidase I
MKFDNIAIIALLALLIAGGYWLLEVFVFAKSRAQKTAAAAGSEKNTSTWAETAQTVVFFATAVFLVRTLGYVNGIISVGIVCVIVVIVDFVFFQKQRQAEKKKPSTLVEYARFFAPIGLLIAAVLKFGILPTLLVVIVATGLLFVRGLMGYGKTDTTSTKNEWISPLIQFSQVAFPISLTLLAILKVGMVPTAIGVAILSGMVISLDLAIFAKKRRIASNKAELPVLVEYSRLFLPIALIALAIILMDLALVLFLLSIATGLVWLGDHFFLAKKRAARPQTDGQPAAVPIVVEFSRFLFPVVAAVLMIRSFMVEPFKIPSESMLPTLEKGDYILVNRFAYGLRLPVLNYKILENDSPKRGDVIVFRYPKNPSIDYIKRVVGLPGDRIRHDDHHLYINGVPMEYVPIGNYFKQLETTHLVQLVEKLGNIDHSILTDQNTPQFGFLPEHQEVTVPEHMYFAMGDNRDHSADSRVWGFVPDANLKGRAFYIWFSWEDDVGPKWPRIGKPIN